jgi:radical SAM protein with 4Fe4S-binding SPASM domain
VNIILSKYAINHLKEIIEKIIGVGVNRLIFLRFKPPVPREIWQQYNPTQNQLLSLHEKLISLIKRYPEPEMRTDCALSFVNRHVPAEISKFTGNKGCVAGDRILAVSPSGDLYLCSQLPYPRMKAGNILTDNPQDVWDKSRVLKKYRLFRNGKTFTESWCGICTQKETCRGCRVFAPDALGGALAVLNPFRRRSVSI